MTDEYRVEMTFYKGDTEIGTTKAALPHEGACRVLADVATNLNLAFMHGRSKGRQDPDR